ncbi:MAG: helix-turn-helix domain-containing protein [Paenibacillaceae bacterium]|nr:helix-turn-helix domain-containing protein [Paenibacillaceae bacterium]
MNDAVTEERMFPDICYAPKALDWLLPGDEWKCGGSYALLAAERGSGTLRLGMRRIGMKRGECLLLAGAETLALEAEPAGDWRLYALAFDVARVSGDGAEQAALPPRLPLNEKLALPEAPQLLRLLSRLHRRRRPLNEAERFRNQCEFQEAIGLLLHWTPALASEELTSREAVLQTIADMREAYDEELTLRALADRAALSPRQYTQLFRELTGTSPMDYLADIRIAKARELLLLSDERLPVISRSVGYRDPAYFGRRFKRSTGESPLAYMRRRRLEGRIVALQYVGHLLLLGITPVGVGSMGLAYHFRNRLGDAGEVGLYPERSTLAPLAPDLILGFIEGERHERLSRIAPTFTLPWEQYPWREKIVKLGAFFGRERVAFDWLAAIDEKAERTGKELARRFGSERTVALLRIWRDELHVYRKHPVLYDLLRLRPPEQVERELRMKLDRFKTTIALHQLPDYAADRLILLVSGDEETQLTLRRVMASPYWAAYPAVQSGRVAICDAGPWYPSDPLSIEAQLRETVALHEAHLH